MPSIYPSPYRKYLYGGLVGLIVLAAALGGVWLGGMVEERGENIAVQAVYDHGYNVGFAAGLNRSATACSAQLCSLKANCEAWETPPERLGISVECAP